MCWYYVGHLLYIGWAGRVLLGEGGSCLTCMYVIPNYTTFRFVLRFIHHCQGESIKSSYNTNYQTRASSAGILLKHAKDYMVVVSVFPYLMGVQSLHVHALFDSRQTMNKGIGSDCHYFKRKRHDGLRPCPLGGAKQLEERFWFLFLQKAPSRFSVKMLFLRRTPGSLSSSFMEDIGIRG